MNNWRKRAACGPESGHDPNLWFPEDRGRGQELYEEPRAICAGCPVREECLAYAIETQEPYGMWGGLTPRERNIPEDPEPGETSCVNCGAPVVGRFARKYCSHACYCAMRTDGKKSKRNRALPTVVSSCAICSTSFIKKPSNKRFCSDLCQRKSYEAARVERRRSLSA